MIFNYQQRTLVRNWLRTRHG